MTGTVLTGKTKQVLAGTVLGAILGAGVLVGCGQAGSGAAADGASGGPVVAERSGGEAAGEHGAGGEGSGGEGSDHHGPGGEGGGEGGGASAEAAREAAMSSPITPLDQPWTGVLGGIAGDARYDAATQTIHTTVRNTLGQTQCYVQVEPHLKSGAKTVGELGPGQVGDLNPGQQATSSLAVASEPNLAGVAFDGYVIHVEVFDCGGSGLVPHSGGEGSGGEGHGPGGEGGSEGSGEGGAAGGEDGSGANLALDETFDAVRGGARLILNYEAASNAFTGTVANTTEAILRQVRIEVHLSNGVELGPTTPVDMAPGQMLAVELPATATPFTGWIAHAEVGGGEGGQAGGEHGGQGGEGGGEHGSGRG